MAGSFCALGFNGLVYNFIFSYCSFGSWDFVFVFGCIGLNGGFIWLIGRYTATTVLALLQEVAHWPPEVKIDWNQLVAKTTTGISNAREYQMVWHHLAYREALLDKFDNGTPLVCFPLFIFLNYSLWCLVCYSAEMFYVTKMVFFFRVFLLMGFVDY